MRQVGVTKDEQRQLTNKQIGIVFYFNFYHFNSIRIFKTDVAKF